MTYLRFHLYYNLPLIVLLSLAVHRSWSLRDSIITAGICGIVVLFTTPWDNWAVKKGIWDFPKDRVLFRIGYCPFEEYLFFIIQTVQSCLLTHLLIPKIQNGLVVLRPFPQWTAVATVLVAWVVLFFIARLGKRPEHFNYLWHLLFWLAPVVLVQWCLGGFLLSQPWVVLASTFFLGSILCCFDIIAIHEGIWFFDRKQTLGFDFGGWIPLEEALFFYLTSMMVTQSYLLFVPR